MLKRFRVTVLVLLGLYGCPSPGTPDAGQADAGNPGLDAAAVMDAMPATDASPHDLGAEDAAPAMDALAPDAEPLDAAPMDAEPADTAFPDAAPVDAGSFHTQFHLSLGAGRSCVVFEDGRAKCWGDVPGQTSHGATPNSMGPNLPYLDLGEPIARLETAENLSCALLASGAVRCFGDGPYGETGYRGGDYRARPDAPTVGLTQTATAIDCGWNFACALQADRQVRCWGLDGQGQLGQGLGHTYTTTAPQPIDLGAGALVTALGVAGTHACALLQDRSVKCWGANGNGSGDASGIGGNLGVGDLRARGNDPGEMGNALGRMQIGNNPSTGMPWSVERLIVATGATCVIVEGGRVKCFGRNDEAHLGTGNTTSYGSTAGTIGDAVPFLPLGNDPATSLPWVVQTVALSDDAGCALLANHRLKCWGRSTLGELGIPLNVLVGDEMAEMGDALPFLDLGTDPQTQQPWAVEGIYAGKLHFCAVLAGHNIKCWGHNQAGALGSGDTMDRGIGPNDMGDNLPLVQVQ
ncbi:MAG: hypothetical protein U1E65_30505 [Myxococcota bacterium]